eukprot:8847278-Prorocentrum_lima.AAC.1
MTPPAYFMRIQLLTDMQARLLVCEFDPKIHFPPRQKLLAVARVTRLYGGWRVNRGYRGNAVGEGGVA